MFATMLRSSLFVSLLLIVSVTLSGCSFDFGAILGGLKNVLGNVASGLGGFIEKGMTFAKDFIGKAKEFITPIVEKGKEIYGKVAPVADKIKNGIDKAEDVVNKVSDAGNAITDFGNKMTEGGNDAVGNKIDKEAPTSEVVADPDNEESEITVKPEGAQAPAAPAATSETLTAKDKETATKAVTTNVNQISAAVDTLSKNIKKLNVSDAEKKATEAQIQKIRDNMKLILKDPTSKEAQALLKSTRADAEKVAATAKKYTELAKGTIDSLNGVVKSLDGGFKSIGNAISALRK